MRICESPSPTSAGLARARDTAALSATVAARLWSSTDPAFVHPATPPTMIPRTPIPQIPPPHPLPSRPAIPAPRRFRCSRGMVPTLLTATIIALTPSPLLPQDTATTDTTPDPRQEGLPLAPRPHDLHQLHRGLVDVGRCQPRRPDPRLRLPRRPLHDAGHRWHRDAPHAGHGLRRAAALQPGRHQGRLHLGPERRRGDPHHLAGLVRHGAGHQGQVERLPVARVDARRQVRHRYQTAPRPGQALDVPCGRRLGDQADRGAREPAHHRRSLRSGRPLHMVRAPHRHLGVQLGHAPVPARRLRPRDRRIDDPVVPLRRRLPPDPEPRWPLAGLRLPPCGRDGAAHPRPGERRRAVARLPRAAGRPGVTRDPRRLSGNVVHPRFARGGGVLRRRTVARPGRRVRAGADPVPGRRRDGHRARGRLRLPGRGRPDLRGQAGPRRGAVAGRGPDRVLADGTRVRHAMAGRDTHPAHRRRSQRAHAGLVPGRTARRLHDLGRRGGRPHLQRGRGRRQSTAPDHRTGRSTTTPSGPPTASASSRSAARPAPTTRPSPAASPAAPTTWSGSRPGAATPR